MKKYAFAFSLFLLTSFTQAHVVLLDPAAAAGSSYRPALRVGPASGAGAPLALQGPSRGGFNRAQTKPKPGWTLRPQPGPRAQPYTLHGTTLTEGVQSITWTANTAQDALPSAYYDEFVLRGTTPKRPGPLWFKVLQQCANSSLDWSEIPASGTSTHAMASPAALLEVLDTQNGPGPTP